MTWRMMWRALFLPQPFAHKPPPLTFADAALPEMGDKLRGSVLNGEAATRLLADPLLRWSLTEIRTKLRHEMENCPIRDLDGLRVLRLWFEVERAFERNLISLVTDGKLADAELARVNKERELREKYGEVMV